jgi:F-type H+-transporting ATPase subunit alpha
VEDQVVALWAATNGYLDEVPVEQVPRFNEELRAHLRADKAVLEEIRKTGQLNDETTEKLKKAIDEFAESFEVRDTKSLAAD